MSDTRSERSRKTYHVLLTVFVAAFMVATAFAVVGSVMLRSRANMLSEIPLQWQRYVNGAIENGAVPTDASPQEVKDWLAGQMPLLSEKVKTSYVNPFAAKKVAAREAAQGAGAAEPPAVTGTGKILVLLVEFAGSDTDRGNTYTGPMHNSVPKPSAENNADYWAPDFSPEHFKSLLFGKKGLTLSNYYKEQSGGLFTVDGYVSAWVQITDHSEWWYGADSRTGGEGSDDLNGPVWRLAIDAAQAAYAQYGTAIPWADFDADGDGWIDGLMVINAGVDQSAGAPSWMVWAHSWFANWPNGEEVAAGLPKVGSYTTEPENEAVGVYAHEYGHQLGLPDEYDTTYIGETSCGFLSLMASGSWGPGIAPDGRMCLGVSPSHINVWGKWVLGWENGATAYFDYSSQNAVKGTVSMQQVEGSRGIRAVKIELPKQQAVLPLPKPRTGSYQLYSGYKPDVTDVMAAVDASEYMITTKDKISVPAASAKLTFYQWYDVEAYYDWLHVEVSADGMTWTTLAGRSTTNANPIAGNSEGNGITGSSGHYVAETMDLSAFAGQSVYLSFRLSQDGGVYGLGWCVDDVVVSGSNGAVWSDYIDADSVNRWVITATDDLGSGWSVSQSGVGGSFRHYYIIEWRNFIGFDQTLATSYQFTGAVTVDFWSHTPGLMIWYRNFVMGDNDVGLHPGRVAIGLVDSHPTPLMMPNGHYVRQRLQMMDAAFGLRGTVPNMITLLGLPTEFPSLAPQPTFDDSGQFYYSQFYKGTFEFRGVMLKTYGVKVTVLSELAGLTGATILVDAHL